MNSQISAWRRGETVDYLNMFLIVLALVLALIIPFTLFLVAYAVFGPLHYLTEINWVRSKDFFVKDRSWVWFGLAMAMWVALPKIHFHFFDADHAFHSVITSINDASNAALYLSLVYLLLTTVSGSQKAVVAVASLVLLLILYQEDFFATFFGFLLPTLVHVYLFTLFFMLYGALKNQSRPGMVSALLLILAMVFIGFFPLGAGPVDERVSQLMKSSRLDTLNLATSELFGIENAVDGIMSWRVQVMIAFAYLYHYLNWFSKTTVIHWHRAMNRRRTVVIVLLWIIMVAIYAFDYRLGFVLTLFLSYAHVILEFPLNVRTLQYLFNYSGRF